MKTSILLFTIASVCLFGAVSAQPIMATRGVIHIKNSEFRKTPVRLDGEWQFFMSELKSPSDFVDMPLDSATLEYIDFPSTWNHLSKARNPGDGFATYRLLVLFDSASDVALSLPDIYTSYTLWINGKRVTSNGTVGITAEASQPQWRPHTVSLDEPVQSMDIVLQVSNFSHANGGIREPIYLGTPDDIKFKRQIATGSVIMLSTSLAVLAVVFLLLYAFATSRDASAIYFTALCLTWSLRAMFSNDYLFNYWFPDLPWIVCVKVEYITLYVMMIWAILFLGSIFKHDVSFAYKVLFSIANIAFTFLTLFFKPSIFTQFLPVYLSFAGLLMVYIVFILIRAVVNERPGIWLMVSALFMGVAIFSYNIISYEIQTPFNPIIINVGYMLMFILTSFVLLRSLGYLKTSVRSGSYLTYDELYEK